VSRVGIAAGPTGAADTLLASDKDNPAALRTGKVLFLSFRFCFTSDIWDSPMIVIKTQSYRMLRLVKLLDNRLGPDIPTLPIGRN
jgi:hypothetical protein